MNYSIYLPLLYYPSAHATQKAKAGGDAKGQITTTTICLVYFSKFNLRSTHCCNKLGLAYFLFFFILSTTTKLYGKLSLISRLHADAASLIGL